MKSGSYSKIYIQVVFAVKGRQNLLHESFRQEVFKYMAGIIEAKGQKSIIVNGVSDHVHLFIGLKPSIAISDLIRDVKNNTSNFINDKKFLPGKFSWQVGFGAFSYSQSHIERVYNYILNQEKHHQTKSFKGEYMELLQKFEIDYKDEYLFEFYDEGE